MNKSVNKLSLPKKIKVGILTEIINYSSGARAPLEIASALSKLGHEVTVFAWAYDTDKKAIKDLTNHNVRIKLITKLNKQYRLITYFLNYYRTIKQIKPQIILFSGRPLAFIAGKLTGIPIIRIYQGTQFNALLEYQPVSESPGLTLRFLNFFTNILVFIADWMFVILSKALVSISLYAAEESNRLYHRKSDKIIYHGTTIFPNIKAARKSTTISLLSVSRITPYKGFHKLIEIVKKINSPKKIQLVIAGSQPKPDYVTYLKQTGGKLVSIIINPSDRELAGLYKKCCIYLTADKYLFFGMPITEAASFAKPSIALNYAAARELIIHGKTGYVADNILEMAYYLQKLVNQPELRIKLGYAAQKRVQKYFTWEKTAKEYEDLISKLIR